MTTNERFLSPAQGHFLPPLSHRQHNDLERAH